MKILLIKLGALGDVLRTTPLLEGLRKQYPSCEITWLVDGRHRSVLENNPSVDRLETLEPAGGSWRSALYDLAINLDKEPEALEALEQARALEKTGFARDRAGKLCAANPASDYALRLGVDDELKFRLNKKTYQEISFEQVGLTFQKEEYVFSLDETQLARTNEVLMRLKKAPSTRGSRIVGINTGAGVRFAGKRLPADSYKRLAEKLHDRLGATVFLLGGADEAERNEWIERNAEAPVVNTGSHAIQVFAGIVKTCDLVITGDTTALHIAIAMKVPVLAYFASTCAQEIELYGRGRKIVSAIACAPCYKRLCPIDEQCMKDLDMDAFVRQASQMLGGN